ncbi:hypothetical protein COEREDRAFT_43850 [Coemansia reversa NRRL 1564]|uniref:AA9 family lytic polysaccharide monooxygenase n=1 Tax=Coemansia reversa (strain ATCC 12441 / NRRL 1564) TaxID=763665 RepID=A0A2G5BAD8_COERN|nr:hypothetical protein COEREDRAFT_43850 [Coemansia reversa NRRL 1564]|eukprot:PIA15975.1 hypothetical protein COEREDRAFT_43850 [Coemansia reversa NRRL 1564]
MLVMANIHPTQAHTTLFYAGANGKLEGRDVCIVPSKDYQNAPIKDLKSTDLRCRTKDISTTSIKKCPVTAGETLSVEWHHIENSVSVDVMSPSHVGPCIIYMAPLESNGEGDVWFKIFEEGYDKSSKKWCTNKVIDNNGRLEIPIPSNILSGDYLVRTELLALHQAKSEGGAQFYPNCVVINVENGKNVSLPKRYAIPGIYDPKDPGILYDRSSDPTMYVIPGPAIDSDDKAHNTDAESDSESAKISESNSDTEEEPSPTSDLPKSNCRKRRNGNVRRKIDQGKP